MEKALINSDKYDGQYVAIKSLDDSTIVGYGDTPEESLNAAEKKGIQAPFLIYIPDKGVVHIYYVN